MLFLAGVEKMPLWTIPAGTAVLFLAAAALTVKPVEPKVAAIFVDQQVGLDCWNWMALGAFCRRVRGRRWSRRFERR